MSSVSLEDDIGVFDGNKLCMINCFAFSSRSDLSIVADIIIRVNNLKYIYI